jgi:hypothetical protein
MTHRWPSEALLRAEVARIRSSIELTEVMEQLLSCAGTVHEHEDTVAAGIRALARRVRNRAG